MLVKVKITTGVRPFFNGRATNSGEEIAVTQAEADMIIDKGWGEITEKKSKKRKRARNPDGTLKGDDPKTLGINEAWVDGD